MSNEWTGFYLIGTSVMKELVTKEFALELFSTLEFTLYGNSTNSAFLSFGFKTQKENSKFVVRGKFCLQVKSKDFR